MPLQIACLQNCPGLLHPLDSIKRKWLLIPIGSFEDREDAPMALDTLIALEVCCRASTKCHAAILWPLGIGYSPKHRYSIELSPSTLRAAITSIVRSAREKIKVKVLLVDGHIGHKDIVWGVAEVEGASYVNVWELLMREGYESWTKQVEFEKDFTTCLRDGNCDKIDPILDKLANNICNYIRRL
ncbi:MAG TPA: hypothetical protein EYP08_05690 [Pyrodictiaceae archaeon]|nr:hypothetical protein [Pyrodictiaceae archaeon]HIQ55906.1 hypothetical protein [Pyrodictium sp.]